MEPASARARRALALIGLAAVAVAAAAAAYLGPGVVRTAWPRSRAPAAATPSPRLLVYASFGDADRGAVMLAAPSQPPVTYLTSDGGRGWTQPPAAASLVTFVDRDHAVAFGFAGMTTADGGRTWTSVPSPLAHRFVVAPGLGVFGGPVFIDPARGWWLDDGTLSGSGPELWRTSDGARTWTRLPATGLPAGRGLESWPTFLDPLRGVIVRFPPLAQWPSLLATGDGGDSWRDVDLPPSPLPGMQVPLSGLGEAVVLAHGNHLVLALDAVSAEAATTPGRLTHWASASQDGGLTWTPWSSVPTTRPLSQSAPAFDGGGHLLVLDDQRLWASSDDGRTWRLRTIRMPAGARIATLLRTGHGALFAAAWRSGPGATSAGAPLQVGADLLLRSRDGGAHWSTIPLPAA